MSGRLDLLSVEQLRLVSDDMVTYKRIRQDLRLSCPFWPLRLPGWHEDWLALGLRFEYTRYVAVWRRRGGSYCALPIAELKGKHVTAECLYRVNLPSKVTWEAEQGTLFLDLSGISSARLLCLEGWTKSSLRLSQKGVSSIIVVAPEPERSLDTFYFPLLH